ncbi:hypothetical protein GCM10023322_25700 [Rugosimonospora acidiphila]|uniref:Uncharacterized protein n=1 Tax=Rugosimonospora acidiphila TaxID=556531 RepID=A0ABP9RSB7_9ACTN
MTIAGVVRVPRGSGDRCRAATRLATGISGAVIGGNGDEDQAVAVAAVASQLVGLHVAGSTRATPLVRGRQGLDVTTAAASQTARSYWLRRNTKGPKLP